MRGHFRNGHIEVEDDAFPDGTPVNFVVVRDPEDDAFELTLEEEDDLEQAIAEIERGECVTAEDLLAQLREMRVRNGG